MKKMLAVLLLIVPANLFAAYTVVQSSEVNVPITALKATIGFNSNTTAGNTIIATCNGNGYVTYAGTALTDTEGNTFVSEGPVAKPNETQGPRNITQHAINIVGGTADSVSCNFSDGNGNYTVVQIVEISGISAYEQAASSCSHTGGTLISPEITTTHTDVFLYAAGGVSPSATSGMTEGAGYTLIEDAHYSLSEKKEVANTGNYTATMTHDGSSTEPWCIWIAAFYGAQGGGGGGTISTTPGTGSISSSPGSGSITTQ